MEKTGRIVYRYSSLAKQAWFYICAAYLFLWAIVFIEIKLYNVENYDFSLLSALILLVIGIAFFITISFGHKACYSEYDDNTITYKNKLLLKEKSFNFKDCKVVFFDKTGIKFYNEENDMINKLAPVFKIPFFRDGKIEAVTLHAFFKKMKNREAAVNDSKLFVVYRSYDVVPGYGRRWKYLSFFYACLSIIALVNCCTPLSVAIGLFQQFA